MFSDGLEHRDAERIPEARVFDGLASETRYQGQNALRAGVAMRHAARDEERQIEHRLNEFYGADAAAPQLTPEEEFEAVMGQSAEDVSYKNMLKYAQRINVSKRRMKKALDGETPREDMLRLIYDQIEKTHKIGGSYVGSQSGYTGSVELRARAPVSSYSESQSGSVTGDGRVSGVNRRSDPGRASGASSRLKLTKSRADNENRLYDEVQGALGELKNPLGEFLLDTNNPRKREEALALTRRYEAMSRQVLHATKRMRQMAAERKPPPTTGVERVAEVLSFKEDTAAEVFYLSEKRDAGESAVKEEERKAEIRRRQYGNGCYGKSALWTQEHIVEGAVFQVFIGLCIVGSGLIVGLLTYEDIKANHSDTLNMVDTIILCFFTCELVLKLHSEGHMPYKYWFKPEECSANWKPEIRKYQPRTEPNNDDSRDGWQAQPASESSRWLEARGANEEGEQDDDEDGIAIDKLRSGIRERCEWENPMGFMDGIQGWNCFEFAIVVACWSMIDYEGQTTVTTLRLLRLFSVARRIDSIKIILQGLGAGFVAIGYIVLLLLLTFYVFAIAFMYFYGDNDRMHFGSIFLSMVTLFRMATFEDWTDLMYTAIYGCRNYILPIDGSPGAAFPEVGDFCPPGSQEQYPKRASGYGKVAGLWYIFFVITSAFVILNLFVGVITASMQETADEERQGRLQGKRDKKHEENVRRFRVLQRFAHWRRRHERMQIFVDNMVGRNTRYGGLSLKREAESAIIPGLSREEKKEEALKRENSKRLFSMYERNRKKFERRKQRAEIKRCHEYYTRFAKEVHHFAHGRIFSMFILLSIVFSAVIVGIRTNEEYIAKHEETYDIFDGIIVGIFTLEVAFGIIGFAWEPWRFFFEPLGGCYTLHRSDTGQRTKDAKGRKGRWSCCMKVRFWNVFNFITTGISYIPGDGKLGMMFRLLRMLRVLKVLSFLKQLQIILTGLIEGLKSMFWVSVIEFLFFYIYAILGMSLFGRNDPLHFGNLGDTFITLFRCATMEDWTEIMYNNMYGCDIFGYENDYSGDWNWMCSEPRARPYQSALYFISFEVVSALIILNLVIGKISFSMMQAQDDENYQQQLDEAFDRYRMEYNVPESLANAWQHAVTWVDDDRSKKVFVGEVYSLLGELDIILLPAYADEVLRIAKTPVELMPKQDPKNPKLPHKDLNGGSGHISTVSLVRVLCQDYNDKYCGRLTDTHQYQRRWKEACWAIRIGLREGLIPSYVHNGDPPHFPLQGEMRRWVKEFRPTMVLASVDSDEEDMPTKPEVPPRGQPSSGGMRGGSVFLDRSATTATAAAPTSPPPPRTLEEMGQDELTAWVRGPYFNSDLGQAVRDSHGVGWTAFVGTDGDPSLPRIGARLMTAFGRGGDEGKVAIDAFLKQQLHIASIGIRHKLTMGIQDLATNPGGHPGGLPAIDVDPNFRRDQGWRPHEDMVSEYEPVPVQQVMPSEGVPEPKAAP